MTSLFIKSVWRRQVWEQIPDKVEFLNHLSERAEYEPAAEAFAESE